MGRRRTRLRVHHARNRLHQFLALWVKHPATRAAHWQKASRQSMVNFGLSTHELRIRRSRFKPDCLCWKDSTTYIDTRRRRHGHDRR
ncbi:uncharacterized protein QC761_101834 [Podospora bellae-mahoneyi]|uniref:Uncharacterized protein n=1 Tax=Podospora bellae-mahoneyi TaxID=2093777 RepID=A0ABR0FU30_9PEZI|nr:hypothetical protein QC761_101834 [Podospora bellae-mahoneyi]